MLNEHAMGTYRAMSRIGPTPPMSALAQLGRYRSMGTAPNVVANGMRNQQAGFVNNGMNGMNPLALMALQLYGGRQW